MASNMERKYNLKSPAVKRLMKEAVELRESTEHYHAQPLEDNLFEWHFSVRGPPDSDFDGGVYHGRIVLPPEYPMKPPSIILLTPNGRFEVGKKICLSISGHHPETWQPSWSIRTALLAIIGFMPTKGEGAIGSLDYTPEERRALAKKSQDFCCEACGCSMRSVLLTVSPNSSRSPEVQKAQELAQQISFKAEANVSRQASEDNPPALAVMDLPEPVAVLPESAAPESEPVTLPPESEVPHPEQVEPSAAPLGRPLSPRQRRQQQHSRQAQREPSRAAFTGPRQAPDSHTGSAVLIVLLTLALATLIFRRIYLAQDYRLDLDL
ncbi:ubiquitin-conjugating enzyme E2 J1 [Periophthalmus magnuspinnatus]|uniref:ubiquitin-conjugating enzyme E2 J1 n=1 Tax=Periophthalmus magnuspinnatus TaxID=409849 RepID=UPI00145A1042|nr:ubiquitin-conjugating enzyme E2 J1 [Periophthalmus magnuspinnatus]